VYQKSATILPGLLAEEEEEIGLRGTGGEEDGDEAEEGERWPVYAKRARRNAVFPSVLTCIAAAVDAVGRRAIASRVFRGGRNGNIGSTSE
jgi:hypothetical protein